MKNAEYIINVINILVVNKKGQVIQEIKVALQCWIIKDQRRFALIVVFVVSLQNGDKKEEHSVLHLKQ